MSEYQAFSKKDIKNLHRDLQDLALEAQAKHGALAKKTSKGHLLLKFPNGQTVLLSGTPSDHRTVKNSRAQIRRATQE